MALSDTKIRNIKPGTRARKHFDAQGLYLEVSAAGGKWWRLRYWYGGKEKRLSLGVYPAIGLKDARERRDEVRKLLANGIDPSENRKAIKSAALDRAANSFEVVAREWLAKFPAEKRVVRLFERDIFPWIGPDAISELAAPKLLTVFRRIESRGALETAHRARWKCGQVFRYAVATSRCKSDPTRDLRGALPPAKKGHFAATTEPSDLAGILRAMDGYKGDMVVRCALRLAPLVFVRPGELRTAEWKDVDLEAAQWSYFVSKTKTPHIVPLSMQAIEILRELQPLTGNGRFIFPGARSNKRPMSDNAVLAALRRMGVGKDEMTTHGFRAASRTILDEVLGVRVDLIETQLAHQVRDTNGRAYNRTQFLPERRKMMQQWADYLDKLKAGAEIVPIAQRA